MPGPVSDSYDPEFGTGANAHDVRDAVAEVRELITNTLGDELKYIVHVAQSSDADGGEPYDLCLSEKKLRIIRFCLDRAMESI